jgi:class 3 adenylate cyclase/tetratricopeptide (TPR) repeat protein
MSDLAKLPEHSFVTVLAVDIHDSTGHIAATGPDDAQAFLDTCFEYVRCAIEREGGMIIAYYGDGGIALFGWPESVEDHADRACNAAWSIVSGGIESGGTKGRPVRFRVGVHSGLVGLRRVELPSGSRLDTVGATVHFAAALQKSAPAGGVHVSSHSTALCRARLSLEVQPDLPLLDMIRASVFRLCARPRPPIAHDFINRFRQPMIGREVERRRLLDVFSAATRRSAAIIGEPGIGKSRLAADAIGAARSAGARVIACFGDSQLRTTPFAAIRALILDAWAPETPTADAFHTAVAGSALDEETIDALAGLLLTGHKSTSPSGSRTQLQTARAFSDGLEHFAAGNAIALLIEDLHLIDPESRQSLGLFARDASEPAPFMILTGRPESLDAAQQIAAVVIELDGMPIEDMTLLAQQIGGRGHSQAFLRRAVTRADGVPFVLEQVMRSITEDNKAALLPGGVESIIHSRLNRLSHGAKQLAQGLSILGEDVPIVFARTVLAAPQETLEREMAELERLAFLYPSDGRSLRFRHAILAEACATTVPRARRIDLHRGALNAIRNAGGPLEDQHERLAFHAQEAGEREAALEYLWLAALAARKRSASQSISLIYERALRIVEEIGEPAEARFVDFTLMAFDSMQQLGKFPEMDRHLERAVALARQQGRRDRECLALCQRGTISWFEARHADGLRLMEHAVAMAKEISALPLIFSAQFTQASLLHGMGEMDRAIALMRDLCGILSGELETKRLGAAGIPGSLVRGFLGWFMNETGQYEEALGHTRRALAIALDEKEPYSEVLARIGLGRTLLSLGRNREAAECLTAAHQLIERNGYDAAMPHVTGLLAAALSRAGDPHEAIRLVEACLKDGHDRRTGRLEIYYLRAGFAEALFRAGEAEACFAELEAAIAVGRACDNPCLLVQGLGLRARLRQEREPRHPAIREDLEEQRALCERCRLVPCGLEAA